MILAWLVVLLVLAVLFTPTWVVAWQLWTSRAGSSRRSLAPRPPGRVVVPGQRQPSA